MTATLGMNDRVNETLMMMKMMMMMMMMIIIIQFNSIHIYLHASLTARWPIPK
jgi:hypothetical protein